MQTDPSCWPAIAGAYGFPVIGPRLQPWGKGLIHRTWLLEQESDRFILQQINDRVFRAPRLIADNIEQLGSWLRKHAPLYYFVHPLPARNGQTLLQLKEGWFRLFAFVPGSHSITAADTPDKAFEAARQFGRFTRVLDDFPLQRLQPALPGFHDLSLRFSQFTHAVQHGLPVRMKEAAVLIAFLGEQEPLVRIFTRIQGSSSFTKRVTHHDTKISNVLLDESGKGICVIDLDTVMPGYFISDAGDMIRTCSAVADEASTDWAALEIRPDYFQAIAHGYLGEMAAVLSADEKDHFVYAGQFMVYMQALRFLSDYLTGDTYYGEQYPGQNLNRAQNQVLLLKQLLSRKPELQKLI